MTRTLQPDSRIAHYRIVGPLGVGGMGEVYLAKDEKLDRNVALKILPPEVVRSEDRVRRFMLEARSASSLNHPNIVTIYEVGHDVARDADGGEGAPGAEPVHYIAMELVSGKTLKDLIHVERTDLRALVGYLAQAAEGLAKAHAAGIVHRDLKPGNIMVTADGYAKVLDFGLAKLTERGGGDIEATTAPTATGDLTGGGMVVGTVGYMAPEQVRGKGVDHRADVFSFGCILYEAATRQRPFAAESHIDTMHRILHDQPAPIDAIDPAVPAELRRLVRRCLAKNPDQRVQSVKDLAIQLREIADEYDALSASATSGSVALPAAIAARRSPVLVAAFAALGVIGIAGIAFGLYSLFAGDRGADSAPRPYESVRMSSLMGHPDLQSATLSRDGRYLAYTTQKDGQWSLRVRQVATGSDVEVLAPRQEGVRAVGFSPDGDYIFFLQQDPDTPIYSALFQVASLGGTPRKRLFDVDSGVGFSPDGRRVAFLRGIPQENRTELLTADLETADERAVVSIAEPERVLTPVTPAWSPDGARIVIAIQDARQGTRTTPTAFNVDGGGRQGIGARPLLFVSSVAWLADGSGLAVTGNALDAISMQLYLVAWPSGATRRITTDLDTYLGVSVAADGALATLRFTGTGDLWVAPLTPGQEARQVTVGSSNSMGDLIAVDDGSIVITDTVEDRRQIVALGADGSNRRTITAVAGHAQTPLRIPGGDGVVFTLVDNETGVAHVYRVDLDGGNLKQLTTGAGERVVNLTPDGSTVLFQKSDRPNEFWSVPAGGGEPTVFLEGTFDVPLISPDGRLVVYSVLREIDGRQRPVTIVAPIAGGAPLFNEQLPPRSGLGGWFPDSSALTYIDTSQNIHNVIKLPLDGGAPARLTRFEGGLIGGYVWSDDGKRLLVCHGVSQAQNLWLFDADGGNPRRITDFRSGFINQFVFLADGQQVAFVQGERRRDVVLIRDAGPQAGS